MAVDSPYESGVTLNTLKPHLLLNYGKADSQAGHSFPLYNLWPHAMAEEIRHPGVNLTV